MILKLNWADFENMVETVFANPGGEGTTIIQPILSYYDTPEQVSLYIPLQGMLYSTNIIKQSEFNEEAFKLEVLKYYNAIELLEQPKDNTITIMQS